jgi:hypothetical protein
MLFRAPLALLFILGTPSANNEECFKKLKKRTKWHLGNNVFLRARIWYNLEKENFKRKRPRLPDSGVYLRGNLV